MPVLDTTPGNIGTGEHSADPLRPGSQSINLGQWL